MGIDDYYDLGVVMNEFILMGYIMAYLNSWLTTCSFPSSWSSSSSPSPVELQCHGMPSATARWQLAAQSSTWSYSWSTSTAG
eukprot:7076797-Heterocapsa_arctica.AAC.1